MFEDGTNGYTTVTALDHIFKEGEVVNITKTTSYNGSYRISSVAANTFKIHKTYTINEMGYATNMSSMDILRKIQVDGSYVQISGTDSNDLYRGRANISWKKNAGDTRIVPFQIKVDVDSVLVYVEETIAMPTTTITPTLLYTVADVDADGIYSDDIVCTSQFNETGIVTIYSFVRATNVLTISKTGTVTNVKVRYWTIRSI